MSEKKVFQEPELSIEQLSYALFYTMEELSRKNKDLKKANEKLICDEKIRNELFLNISHDLRSPLTALKNAVEYMDALERYETEEMKKVLDLMKKRINTLEYLVRDFFTLTTIEDESIPFHIQRIDAGELIEDFFYLQLADEKYQDRKLQIEVPEGFSVFVDVDPMRLEQALDNLFTNAFKYSQAGACITLKVEQINKEQVAISVKDTGIGIPEDKLDKIFQRSYKVDEARTPEMNAGCGLGLSITEQIVKRLHGEIKCNSVVKEGSTFTITLPCVSQGNNKVIWTEKSE